MKFIKSIKVLAVILFLATNIYSVWADAHIVRNDSNVSVTYLSGGTEQEAQALLSYTEQLQMSEVDLRVSRDDDDTLVVSVIPSPEAKAAELKNLAQVFEQDVFNERVVIAACDEKFKTIYKVNEVSEISEIDATFFAPEE